MNMIPNFLNEEIQYSDDSVEKKNVSTVSSLHLLNE